VTSYQHDIEQLARLVAALPPPPEGWVAAAQALPAHRRDLDALLALAEHDAELRARLVRDLESALAESGIRPTPRMLELARDRLSRS
jgi:hypothetical protein